MYGARFRREGRKAISGLIEKRWQLPKLSVQSWTISDELVLDTMRIPVCKAKELDHHDGSRVWGADFNFSLWNFAVTAHQRISTLLHSSIFIQEHGIYIIDEHWIYRWIKLAGEKQSIDVTTFGKLGYNLYASRLRHQSARDSITKVFVDVFKLKPTDCTITDIKGEKPYVLTPNVLRVWKQMAWALHAKQPLLITGDEGCGKSDCVLAIASVLGVSIHQSCLTPETEPASLVGQLAPSDSNEAGGRIVWHDGVVTTAFLRGEWALLDNLSQAEASVLERLNPVVSILFFSPPFCLLICLISWRFQLSGYLQRKAIHKTRK